MRNSKMFFNISVAISILLCSLSLFIYSCQSKPENKINDDGYKIAGVVDCNGSNVRVIGYNPTTGRC